MKINATFDEMTRDLAYVKTNISSQILLQNACLFPTLEKYDLFIVYIINHKLRISTETKKNRIKLWGEFKEFCRNKRKTPEMSLNDAKSFYWDLCKNIIDIGDWDYSDFNHQIRDYFSEFNNPIVLKKRFWGFIQKIFLVIIWFYLPIDISNIIEYIPK